MFALSSKPLLESESVLQAAQNVLKVPRGRGSGRERQPRGFLHPWCVDSVVPAGNAVGDLRDRLVLTLVFFLGLIRKMVEENDGAFSVDGAGCTHLITTQNEITKQTAKGEFKLG